MEDKVKLTMLMDFYAKLLSESKRQVMIDYVENDFSLSEIASIKNVTRQAAYDIVKKAEQQLEEYEAKLGLVERFVRAKNMLLEVSEGVDEKTKQKIDKIIDNL